MFITNVEKINKKYECNKKIAKYLKDNDIPLLSEKDGIFYFAKTEKLEDLLKNLPWHLKIF